MKERFHDFQMSNRFVSAEEAAKMIKNGMTIATSGFAASGYPKAILRALAGRRRSGENINLNFINSSNLGTDIEAELTESGVLKRLTPFQMTPACASFINKGLVEYAEMPLSKVASYVRGCNLGEIDVAIIEAMQITSGNELVLTSGIGLSPLFVDNAKYIMIELTTAQPNELIGMHDIYRPATGTGKAPIPLYAVNERIGVNNLSFDPEKLIAVVATNEKDAEVKYASPDLLVSKFADNLFNFLEIEKKRNPSWRGKLPPVQSGVGSMANNLVQAFIKTNFRDIEFFCGLLQEANIDLLARGQAKCASGSAVHTTARVRELFASNPQEYQKLITLRPMEVTNCAEIIDRMQIIAMNSAIEMDIYGNANLSHVMGSKIVNGTGGGSTFAQNAGLSVMLLPSTSKGGNISTIVPRVTYQDISAHYIDLIVTDTGVADLRCKTPVERAWEIINNCVDQIYKDELSRYLKDSLEQVGGHEPQLLDRCFEWHKRFSETGSMIAK